jgi:hypothetical protein
MANRQRHSIEMLQFKIGQKNIGDCVRSRNGSNNYKTF